MQRKEFLKTISLAPLLGVIQPLQALGTLAQSWPSTPKMPVLFLGHGSPMNAIQDNEFVKGFRDIASTIIKPKVILCISAHWETKGTKVTAMKMPRTIHDFGGFPQELHKVQYPAPGSPELAKMIQQTISSTKVEEDYQWGLDHGAWSVLKHMYPQANIPVVQMSLDYTQAPAYHFALAQQLQALRYKGVLIVSSGNMVHNLAMIDWKNMNSNDFAYDWAREASQKLKEYIQKYDTHSLLHYHQQGKALQLAIPTPEHYLPLLYTLALRHPSDHLQFFNDKAVAGSLTMTSLKYH